MQSLSNYTPAATEAKYIFFVKYLATRSREDGAQFLKFQFACTNPLLWSV